MSDTAPTEPYLPTEAEILAGETAAGGYTQATTAAWGVPWPLPAGWKQDLIARARAAAGQGN